MANKLGLDKPRENEFKIYKDSGRPVRVHIGPNESALGVIDSYSTGYIYLKPSLSHEGLYNLDGSVNSNARIETELPHKVNIASISHIEPLSGIKDLENLVDSLTNVGKPRPKIIIVKK